MTTYKELQDELKALIADLDKRITDIELKIDKIPTEIHA